LPALGITGHVLAVMPFGIALPNGGGTSTRHRLTIATDTKLDRRNAAQADAVQRAVDDTDAALKDYLARMTL